jgi:hypothetical protein
MFVNVHLLGVSWCCLPRASQAQSTLRWQVQVLADILEVKV